MNTKGERRLQWRRDKVRELSIKGYSQRQISSILKIALVTVNEDLKYLRQLAKENIKSYIDEYLPAEYEFCLDGLNGILQQAWQMSFDDEDKRGKLQALSLAKECYAMKIDLLCSATVVDRAIQFVKRNRRGLTDQNKEVTIDDVTELIENTR